MTSVSKSVDWSHNYEIYVGRLMQEIYEKFSNVDKSIFNWLSLLEKEKGIIDSNEKKHKLLDTRVNQVEKEMEYMKERVQVVSSKVDMKQIRKHSNSKKGDVASMESMIETQIYHELKKFDKVVEKMMNFEGKMYYIDSHLKTLESQLREGHFRFDDNHSHQESIQNLRNNKNYEDKSDKDNNYDESSIWNRNVDEKSLNSAIKHFKENIPHPSKGMDANPDLMKYVSTTQKGGGRNTACEPTIRESDNNLIVEEKSQNASKRKSSMPNVPNYTKSTRNLRKGATSAFVNRHYSTERGNSGCTKDSVERNLTNTSWVIGTPQEPHSFMNISNPNSRQSNNYSGYALMNSATDPNPQFFEALKRRGLERILKQA